MSIFGSNTGGNFNNWISFGWNSENMVATTLLSFPAPGGTITSLSAFHASGPGAVGAINWAGVIWDAAGNILAQSAQAALPAGSDSSGGQTLQTVSLSLAVSAAQQIRIGWWRSGGTGSSTDDDVMSYFTGRNSFFTSSQPNTSGPQIWTPTNSYSGDIEVYVTYTPTSSPSLAFSNGIVNADVYELIIRRKRRPKGVPV